MFGQCVLSSNQAYAQLGGQTIVNGFDPDSPPFSYLNDSDVPVGFDIQLIHQIAQLQGFQVSDDPVPFSELIPTLQGGFTSEGDVVNMINSGITITPEREAQVSFTKPYMEVQTVLLTSGDSNQNLDEILSNGNVVAVRDGSSEADWIAANLIEKEQRNIQVYYYDSYGEAVDDMLNGVVSSIAMNDLTAGVYAESDGLRVVGPLGMPSQPVAFAVKKGNTELLNALNEGLTQLLASYESTRGMRLEAPFIIGR